MIHSSNIRYSCYKCNKYLCKFSCHHQGREFCTWNRHLAYIYITCSNFRKKKTVTVKCSGQVFYTSRSPFLSAYCVWVVQRYLTLNCKYIHILYPSLVSSFTHWVTFQRKSITFVKTEIRSKALLSPHHYSELSYISAICEAGECHEKLRVYCMHMKMTTIVLVFQGAPS